MGCYALLELYLYEGEHNVGRYSIPLYYLHMHICHHYTSRCLLEFTLFTFALSSVHTPHRDMLSYVTLLGMHK